MLATEHTQSVTTFREKSTEILDRLNRTGEAEILTVNGEARAVLLSPAAYDQMVREGQLARDVATIRRSMNEFEEGKGRPVDKAFDDIRTRFLKMQADKARGKAE
jgi:prevent-host-death family protein